MRIALTKKSLSDARFENYIRWVHRLAPEVETVPLFHQADNHSSLDSYDGLILTGGGDVHPRRYGIPDAFQSVEGVDEERDSFEFAAVKKALEGSIPVLGICRGLQVVNVVLGGSLLPDIEKSGGGYGNHRKQGLQDRRHLIVIEPASRLLEIVGLQRGEVNSGHHQAADRIGEGLRVAARSQDGVIEALEWWNPDSLAFLLLVQWHPERMDDFDNPFSINILRRFLSAVEGTTRLRKIDENIPTGRRNEEV